MNGFHTSSLEIFFGKWLMAVLVLPAYAAISQSHVSSWSLGWLWNFFFIWFEHHSKFAHFPQFFFYMVWNAIQNSPIFHLQFHAPISTVALPLKNCSTTITHSTLLANSPSLTLGQLSGGHVAMSNIAFPLLDRFYEITLKHLHVHDCA